ncbi:pectate lyase superfamily protein-domain-containing protein [Dichotomopilus funicola]|uniref:Pectate lyase superfamily protein-domain-containing protein n=1 Tax=Dichotomopilus funicola TaxID=1934379 RepID=A0AAN6V0D0_9PEZI|nr:pectate lyase superfamily protein-domain-containing protein [Dichotomopilus funicola]
MAPSRTRLPWLAVLLSLLVFSALAVDGSDAKQVAEENLAPRGPFQDDPRDDTAASIHSAVNKHASISQERVSGARAIVAEAIRKVAASNKERRDNPQRNVRSADAASTSHARRAARQHSYHVTSDVAAAAALVAELDAADEYAKGTLHKDYSRFGAFSKRQPLEERAGGYWMASLENLGTQPFGRDSTYKVFRNVKDYGAKGDGVTDDTAAINKAITDGKRCGENCYGSSVTGAVVYFPPGTYLVSGSIISYFHTQLVGDPTNLPVIKAAASFVGLGVISTDVYVPNGGTGIDGNSKEWYINTANFYRQIRNFVIDITATDQGAYVAALHYQVAQATSLTNIKFIASQNAGTTQQAIYAENGSGGFISDLTFEGGAFGIYGGNQQFTAARLQFVNCVTAIKLIWDWGWVWREISISGSQTGISLLSEDGVHHTGSVLVQDSTFTNTKTAILTFTPVATKKAGTAGITLDNVAFSGVTAAIADNAGKTWLAGSVGKVDTYTIGPAFFSGAGSGNFTLGTTSSTPRLQTLTGASNGLPKTPYFSRQKPLYVGATIVQMKKYAKGDGVTDDTAAFQSVINQYAGTGTVIFVDAGSYILTDTINVPSGTKIVGQCWSQLVASGAKFQDASNPRVLFRVGAEGGETGTVEIQDLLFTTKGTTAGLVAVEWNMEASAQGTAAMWDCHVRIGGAAGTDLSVADCPAVTSGTDQKCIAGSMMFHMTSSASAYIENMWLWTADHDLDDANMTQTSVYVARGMLVESVKPVWLYGTASEHAVFYQYEFYRAQQVLAAMIQTESPYYQPNPLPPAPFQNAVGAFHGDPDLDCPDGQHEGCDASWALRMVSSSNITIAGAGLYSWFQTYSQTCVDTQNCQLSLVQLKDNSGGIHLWNLITIGALKMISSDAGDAHTDISALDYTNVDYHPYWSQVSLFEPPSVPDDGGEGGNVIYVPTTIWAPGGAATASCIPPCTLVLPPSLLGSTTTISWPPLVTTLLSSAAGGTIRTITTTISIPAITTTAIDWWPVTVKSGDPTTAVITPVQSVKPPPTHITLPPNVATAPPTPIPEYSNGSPVSSSSSTTTTILPIFFPTSHPVTIQPQPTVSVSLPTKEPVTTTLPPSTTTFGSSTITYPPVTTTKSDTGPVVTYTSAKPASTSEAEAEAAGEVVDFSDAAAAARSLAVAEAAACLDAAAAVRPLLGALPEINAPLTNAAVPGARTEVAELSLRGTTNCHPYAQCDATDKTTTSTITEPEPSFGTVSVTVSNRGMGRQPASLVNSLASQVISDQYSWDLTRFGAMPTGGDGGDGGKTVPTGPNGVQGVYWTWFISRSLSTGAYGLGTYSDRPNDQCTNTGEWTDPHYQVSEWIYDVQVLTVFGDSSCSYKSNDQSLNHKAGDLLGTITCTKWKDAKCYKDTPGSGQKCPNVNDYDFPMAYCNWD